MNTSAPLAIVLCLYITPILKGVSCSEVVPQYGGDAVLLKFHMMIMMLLMINLDDLHYSRMEAAAHKSWHQSRVSSTLLLMN